MIIAVISAASEVVKKSEKFRPKWYLNPDVSDVGVDCSTG